MHDVIRFPSIAERFQYCPAFFRKLPPCNRNMCNRCLLQSIPFVTTPFAGELDGMFRPNLVVGASKKSPKRRFHRRGIQLSSSEIELSHLSFFYVL